MPTLPHYGSLSPLAYVGMGLTVSAIISIVSIGRHAQRALDSYNGME